MQLQVQIEKMHEHGRTCPQQQQPSVQYSVFATSWSHQFITFHTAYETRECSSRMYHWTALVVSQLAAEFLWNMPRAAMFFLCCYWTVRFFTGRLADYIFLVLPVAVLLFYTMLGHGIASMALTTSVVALYFTTFLIFLLIFDGVIESFMELN
ncbi:uncharacterized protein EDB93DRAFT_484649 [Suillus bovinus]|uniref:uncharacterized protein n=1 Tax=Suillus bovinus TaxID=48563 RepID=UPI001B885D82|nr:uncharacterized protein EDB93DRAFT_484649 [Suillus bovinus]KAG2146109.1 hypothetical protein EDB93DRAFT_484649 [Suillus bovinus]